VAYTMVATQDDQTVRKQRNSALIVMANARIWESEGWDITITDADGNEFDLVGFEETLAQASSWLQPRHVSAPDVQAAEHFEANEELADPEVEQTEPEAEHFEAAAGHAEAEAESSDEELEYAEDDVEHSEWNVEPA
jgi:hypothetical protein